MNPKTFDYVTFKNAQLQVLIRDIFLKTLPL